jgi:2-amino-4-hydroxy-6-hydroxymethyldihydropteridine diphosphokinase
MEGSLSLRRAFIAVGSNIEPERNIPAALRILQEYCPVLDVSRFYITQPLGSRPQPDFRNGVFLIESSKEPASLRRDVLRPIEKRLGRVRTADRFAPRTIDLDIALIADCVLEEDGLRLPDPDIRERAFVAVPILELDADAVLPDTGERVADLPIAQRRNVPRPVDEALTRTLKEILHGR